MKKLIKKLTAKLGYQTDKKQILILSDDWGSVRLKSLEARESLRRKGINVDANRFDRYDCLESNKDLEGLFEILTKHKDHLGNHPCITAVTNVANPDFNAIKKGDFKQYYYETNADTYNRYPASDRVVSLTKEGINHKIFQPQSHAREHVQINWWMKELQNPVSIARKVFEEEFFFLGQIHLIDNDLPGLWCSLDAKFADDFITSSEITDSALDLFKNIYNYPADYFCPPAHFYSENILPKLSDHGIKWLDVARIQRVARFNKKHQQSFRILGQKSKFGFKYLVRNAVFETNFSKQDDGVKACLKDIQNAFDCKQPAIISNHRASFVGGIEEKNRTKGLKALNILFSTLIKQWPDIEFISVNDLKN